jgi:xylan 1,4-beta-xylosidase
MTAPRRPSKPVRIEADTRLHGEPLHHHWNLVVGAGRAAEGLRANWQEHLRTAAAECGFRYVRFHGLFHDDMFVYKAGDEGPEYNFQYIDEVFDRMLDAGVRPFVEFGFSPGDLAREKKTVFWWGGHGSPPTDLGAWADLVTATVAHWQARYGAEEVRHWYFEVWNEPNLDGFFRGTRSEYYELYAVTVRALKSLDPVLRVGGPSTTNFVPDGRFDGEVEDRTIPLSVVARPEDLDGFEWRPVWIEHFLDHCASEGLPVDFISCHPYPTDWAFDEHGNGATYARHASATAADLAVLRRIVDASAFPEAEIHLTEWNSTPSSRDHTHDYPQAATFIVRANLESIGLADSLAYWTFTDVFEEAGAGPKVFHGGFGMINHQGIVKPSFHAYRLLHTLGDELLARVDGAAVTRDADTGRIACLAYHYPDEMTRSVPLSQPERDVAEATLAVGGPRTVEIELSGLEPDCRLLAETVGPARGDALAAWRSIGEPEPPSREELAALRAAARETPQEVCKADAEGHLRFTVDLQPWEIVSLRQL